MATNKLLFWALMFWCIRRAAPAISGESRLTLTTEKLVLAPDKAEEGGIVTVGCKAVNLAAGEILKEMELKRQVVGDPEYKLLVADYGQKQFVTSEPGMSAAGNLITKELTLRMEQTKCADAGNYSCTVSVFPVENAPPETDVQAKNLEVEVSPGNISLIADPIEQSYMVNTTLTLKCNGPVGTVVEGTTQVAWVWQYRSAGSTNSTWQTVDENHACVYDYGTPIKKNCYEMRQSGLERNLTTEDTNRVYRCYVNRNGQPYDKFAATYTVERVSAESTTTPESNTGGSSNIPFFDCFWFFIGIEVMWWLSL